ncbi:hypothetical protein C2I36_08015 [Rhodobacteraceae bacterium WD3A24]|nr:hypothetical protein C2I36_08015 [Rhodobacteraceae bacterium WD3A24]
MAGRGQEFDAARARTKRPLPLWVDALMRDTSTFEADELGAYLRLLMTMWSTPDLCIPDDPRRLARAAGVSKKLWNGRVGELIRPLLCEHSGGLSQKRLIEEARYIERHLAAQSKRKRASGEGSEDGPVPGWDDERGSQRDPQLLRHDARENSANSLKSPDQGQTADISADSPGNLPTQQPNNPTLGRREDARACPREAPPSEPTHRERLLEAMGADPVSGLIGPNGRILGRPSDMEVARRWSEELGLGIEDQLGVIREVMRFKDPTIEMRGFGYFTPAMRELASARNAPRLSPAAPKDGASAPHPMPTITAQLPKEYQK